MKYLLFGDSIAWGMSDYIKRGWAGRLRKYIYLNKKHTLKKSFLIFPRKNRFFKNFSIPGQTTTGLLKKLRKIEHRYKKIYADRKFLVIIAIGTNDSRINKSSPHKNISETIFKKNINEIIKISKGLSSDIWIIGLLPVYEKKTSPFMKKNYYLNKRIERYDKILKSCSKKENIKFIELYDFFIKKDIKLLLKDGLHPNKTGHQLIYEHILKNFNIERNL
jgi:lysophospholipase L1-like esterase